MNYEQRITRAIEFIGRNLSEELSPEKICAVAYCSKFHFHRLFTAYTGLSLQQYIRWLRLKRSAHHLVMHSECSIIDVAFEAGFESHQAFTRAFKQACGMTPKQFRSESSWAVWDNPPYVIPNLGSQQMNVTIRQEASRRFAVVEHRGDPNLLGQSVNKLISWAKGQTVDLKPNPGQTFGYAYDDPGTTEPEAFRFDLALTIPESLKLKGDEVQERWLPAGRYAVATHKGSRATIADTIYQVFRDWLPNSNESLGELPCLFCYKNFDNEVAETELITECWFLLKS